MRRFAIGLGIAALALAFTATPAQAANPYVPSEADFADCPAKPPGASEWTCHVYTAVDGQIRFKNSSARINNLYRLTVAVGKVNGQNVTELGGFTGNEMPFVKMPGTPIEFPDPIGWKVKLEPTGHLESGFLNPVKELGIKAKLIGDGLGDNCYIGPIVLKPKTSWTLPWVFSGTIMLKAKVYDDVFAIDWATGCASTAPNLIIGKANATSNYFTADWARRSRSM